MFVPHLIHKLCVCESVCVCVCVCVSVCLCVCVSVSVSVHLVRTHSHDCTHMSFACSHFHICTLSFACFSLRSSQSNEQTRDRRTWEGHGLCTKVWFWIWAGTRNAQCWKIADPSAATGAYPTWNPGAETINRGRDPQLHQPATHCSHCDDGSFSASWARRKRNKGANSCRK